MTSKILLVLSYLACLQHLADTTRKSYEISTSTEDNSLSDLNSITSSINNSACAIFNPYKNLFEEMNSPNHPLIQVYYNRMVQKLYDTMPTHLLFQQLWQIYRKCDSSTFVAMARAQLSLFWQHNMNEYPDHDYLLMVANGFYRIKNYNLYSSLNSRTQLLFDRALKSLPNSLHYLFGHREFCLMNRKHQEMLYQTDSDEFNTNQELRLAFTWHLTKLHHPSANKITAIFEDLNISEAEEEDPEQLLSAAANHQILDLGSIPFTLNVVLVDKHFKSFYSRWPSYNDKVGGNKTELFDNIWQRDLNIWSVQLVEDDQLVFVQNKFLMCATLFYDNKRRFVFGMQNKTALDTECQWSAGKCDRR